MRTYYIFFIDSTFVLLYKDKPSLLYRNFYELYNMKLNNYDNCFSIYSQLIFSFNKTKLNEYIYNRHSQELSYSYYNNIHTIYNKFTNESTKLIVYNSYLKVHSNKNCPCFFNTLYQLNKYFFICDFNNHDYFWIRENFIKLLV